MKLMGLLCGMTIVIGILNCNADFKTTCGAINNESAKRSIYYHRRCMVAHEPAAKVEPDSARTRCHDMEKTKYKGHLAYIQDVQITKATKDGFPIPVLTNTLFVNTGEPNNASHADNKYEDEDCRIMVPNANDGLNVMRDVNYNPEQQYKRWEERNKIGKNTTLIESGMMTSRIDCAYKCCDALPCQAFSFNKQTGDCRIYWTSDQALYPVENKDGYDFYILA